MRALSQALAGHAARFRALLDDPRGAQERVLARLLAANAQSAWGKAHGFARIRDAAGYASAVPVAGWERFEPFVQRAAAGEANVLTCEPVIAFEETGGSSGGSKLVPYTASALQAFRQGLLPWLDDLLAAFPGLADGRAYWAISPAGRAARLTSGGIPVGLPGDAAYFGEDLAPAIVASLAVPPEVGAIADAKAWREATLSHLLACRDLTMISVWSPSFLTELLRAAGRADFATLWPRLRVISCWDQASARAPAEALRRLFPAVTVQGKGLLATEGLVTIPLTGHDHPVLALESGYWEFMEDGGRVLGAHEVEQGAEYALVMSTASGLYRYAIGDRVRIRGFAGRTPTLEFVGRAATSDLCGEKLSDAFVAGALDPLGLAFAMLCPETAQGDVPRYVLLVDEAETDAASAAGLGSRVEDALAANPQYAYARRIGQLGAVTARPVAGPLQRWIARGLARGQRLGDIKLPALGPAAAWADPR
jgi:hypothetical protein